MTYNEMLRVEYWRGYSAFTSGYQSVDRLSDIDEFEESFRYIFNVYLSHINSMFISNCSILIQMDIQIMF